MPAPTTMVIFGASGDLTKRKLVPALYSLARDRLLPPAFAVVGLARRDITDDAFRDNDARGVRQVRAPPPRRRSAVGDVRRRASSTCTATSRIRRPTSARRSAWPRSTAQRGTGGNRVFYLSTPPSDVPGHRQNSSGAAGLINRARERAVHARDHREAVRPRSRVARRRSTSDVHEVLREDQIYRIDHYLGKETVQNLLVFRFANGIFEPLWNSALHRPRAAHRRRGDRRRGARRLLRAGRHLARHGAEPHVAVPVPDRRWSRRSRSTPRRCATRR